MCPGARVYSLPSSSAFPCYRARGTGHVPDTVATGRYILSDRMSKVPSCHVGHGRKQEVSLLGKVMESSRGNRHDSQIQPDPTIMAEGT